MATMQMQGAFVLKEVFLAAFVVMMLLYALRLTGFWRSEHHDTMTDAAHFIMALAMFAMIAWPNWFM